MTAPRLQIAGFAEAGPWRGICIPGCEMQGTHQRLVTFDARRHARPLLLLSLVGIACAPAIRTATNAGLEGSLDTMSDHANQKQFESIVTSEEIQASTTALTAAATEGVLSALDGAFDDVDIEGSTAEFMSSMGEGTEKIMRENIAPGMAAVIHRSVDTTLVSASSEANLARTEKIVYAATGAAVRGMMAALAEGIREDMNRASVGTGGRAKPLAAELLANEEFKLAVGGLVNEMSHAAVLGAEGAIDGLYKEDNPRSEESFFSGLSGQLSGGWAAMVGLIAVLAVVFITLVVMVISASLRRKHLDRDAQQRDDMMLAFMRVVAGESSAASPELRAQLQRLGIDDSQLVPPMAEAEDPSLPTGPRQPTFNQG